ncbi:hypothetical protein V8G54_025748 [Vigna mungo]|uniref:SET domain-containing protein n=1 Tax=Vigna mungo TaxID=3915 RepID=A0AAQ3RLE7_VIGMU
MSLSDKDGQATIIAHRFIRKGEEVGVYLIPISSRPVTFNKRFNGNLVFYTTQMTRMFMTPSYRKGDSIYGITTLNFITFCIYCHVQLMNSWKDLQITISYVDEDLPFEERQASLADYGFRCRCPKCIEEEP